MKILLVNDVPVTGGHGTENHISMLAEALAEQGQEVHILTGQHRGGAFEAEGRSCAIPDLAAPLIRKRQIRHIRSMRDAIRQMNNSVARIKPDVIHVHNMLNPFTLKALHRFAPIVKSIHDCRPFCSKPPSGNVASRLIGNSGEFCTRTFGPGCFQRCYVSPSPKDFLEGTGFFLHNILALRQVRRCEAVVVYSEYLQRLAGQSHCDPGRVHLIHLFTEPPQIPARDVAQRTRKIVFAGFLAYEKGVMHLLDAIRLVPGEFETVIIGSGPLEAEARARAEASGKKVTFTGYLPQEEVLGHFRTCAVVVFPSIGSEGCGMVGLESLAHGKPVVGFDTGGVTEWLVNGVTGYLAPRGDVEKLALGIRSLLADELTCRKMGDAGRELVAAKFRKDLHVGRLLGVYAQAVRERQTMTAMRRSVGKLGGNLA